jgi:hypothetical protein
MNTHYRHTRTTSESTTLDWSEAVECPHCHTRSKARVVASGSSTASYDKHWSGGQEDAEGRAGVGAFEDAMDNAKAMIRRARCPKCGERGQGGGVVFAIHFVVSALLLGVATALLTGFLTRHGDLPGLARRFLAMSPAQLALGCAVAGAGLALLTTMNALSTADAKVRFEAVQELPAAKNYRP